MSDVRDVAMDAVRVRNGVSWAMVAAEQVLTAKLVWNVVIDMTATTKLNKLLQ